MPPKHRKRQTFHSTSEEAEKYKPFGLKTRFPGADLLPAKLLRVLHYGQKKLRIPVLCKGDQQLINGGLRLAAQPDAPEERLQRMLAIVQTEKHRVAPGCATCAMPCGNTNDYDFVRLWAAPESIRTLKLQMLSAAFALAQKRPQGQAQAAVYQLLFTLAEDWDEELLAPVVQRARELCRE